MARNCKNCGKGFMAGHAVAHSKLSSNRKFRPNLQKYLGKWFCASCLKKLKSYSQTPAVVTTVPSLTVTQ